MLLLLLLDDFEKTGKNDLNIFDPSIIDFAA